MKMCKKTNDMALMFENMTSGAQEILVSADLRELMIPLKKLDNNQYRNYNPLVVDIWLFYFSIFVNT